MRLGSSSRLKGQASLNSNKEGIESQRTIEKSLDLIYAKVVKLRNVTSRGVKCVVCNNYFDIKVINLGHYIPRSVFGLRWDDNNCHPQCPKCNCEHNENTTPYRKALINKIGEDNVLALEKGHHSPPTPKQKEDLLNKLKKEYDDLRGRTKESV